MANYDFTTLSPTDFELLICDLLREEHGWRLEAFRHSPDGGVDLRAISSSQTVIIQCKHYAGSTFSQLLRAAKLEVRNVDKIKPTRYLFATSQELTIGEKDKLVAALKPWVTEPSDVLCRSDLNRLLDAHTGVERSHFKLWLASSGMLERIVNSGIWERSEALMEEVQDRVKLYTATPSYDQAFAMLESKHVVAISGGPGVGKSMLADMLCLTHWNSGWQIVSLPAHDLDRCWDAWRKDEKQLFYFDDVFGQTDLTEQVGVDAGSTLSRFMSRVCRNAKKRLVVTTRTNILRLAEQRDEPISRANLSARECVVQIDEYSLTHRGRVLYNHLYFSPLERDIVRDFSRSELYVDVVQHHGFRPRTIEQILLNQEHVDAEGLHERLIETLDNPVLLWGPSFQGSLDQLGREILLQLICFPVFGARPEQLRRAVVGDTEPLVYSQTIRSLEGTWIKTHGAALASKVHTSFNDPSCRDYVLNFLDSEPDYLPQLLARCFSIQEVDFLLSYSIAERIDSEPGQTVPKYPAMRLWVKENGARLAATIRERSFELGPSLGDPSGTLSSLLDIDELLALGLQDSLLQLVQRIPKTWHARNSELNTGATIRVVDIVLDAVGVEAVDEALVTSLELLCDSLFSSITDIDDWLLMQATLARLDELEKRSHRPVVIREKANSAIESWLEIELDNLWQHLDDLDAAAQYLHQLRDVVGRCYSGQQRLISRIDFAENREVDRLMDKGSVDASDSEVRQSSRSVSERSGASRESELSAIENMFQQLR